MNNRDKYFAIVDENGNFLSATSTHDMEDAEKLRTDLDFPGSRVEERTADFGDGKDKVAIFIPHQSPAHASRMFHMWAELVDDDFDGDIFQEDECRDYVCHDYNSVEVITSKECAEWVAANYRGHQEGKVRALAKSIAGEWDDIYLTRNE